MFKKVSNLESLLREIKVTESGVTLDFIKKHNVTDRSKIGDEFEGIAKKIFDKSLPQELECFSGTQVKFSSIQDLSYKIDLTVVQENSSISLPNSNNLIVPSDKVLAAIEIKKTYTKKLLVEDIKKIVGLKDKIITDIVSKKLNSDEISIHYANKLFDSCVLKSFERAGVEADPEKITELQKDLLAQFGLQGWLPFTSCFGFSTEMSEEKFIEAFIEGVKGTKVSTWPDIVTCGKMSIVKLDERPYSAPYFYLNNQKFEDICIIYGFLKSDSLAHYVEHIWEKLNTNIPLNKSTYIRSDTNEAFSPVLALVTLKETKEVVFIRMEGEANMVYSENGETVKMLLETIDV